MTRRLLPLLALLLVARAGAQTQVASDNFNRASLGTTDWTQLSNADGGDIQIVASTEIAGSVSGNQAAARWVGAGTFDANQYASIVVDAGYTGSANYGQGVIVRSSADATSATRDYYYVYIADVTVLGKILNGSNTTLVSSGTPTWAATDRIGLQVIGTLLTVTKNGSAVTSFTDISDASLSTGQPGVVALGDPAAIIQGDDWQAGNMAAADIEQHSFRWGVDDGNEAAHTFEAALNTDISIADTQSRLLRVLVNTQAIDPAAAAYTLRYKKNGAGNYAAVPVGTTSAFSITNQNVAASADDAQQVGTTMTLTGTTIGASLDATTDWAAMRFTNIAIPAGATITTANIDVVPSGTGEDEPLVTVFMQDADDCATFTTTASDISNRSRTTGVSWSSANLGADGATYFSSPSLVSDVQTVINRAGWASGNDLCVIVQGGATTTRDLTIEAQDLGPNTNPPRIDLAWTVPNEVYVTTSANITAGGEATTARLTAPAGKTTGDFVTGRRWDDENGTDTIDITNDDYTEVEWLVALAATPIATDFFDFRVYSGAGEFEVYTEDARWTIPSAGGSSMPVKMRLYQQMHRR